MKPFAGNAPRHFKAEEVPLHWQTGDRFMEMYEVLSQVGKGGMGVVHRIRHKGWGIDLAVKTPKPSLLPLANSQEQFERECETWVSLDPHPNVAQCYYVRRLGGVPRIFMEYVDGGSLTSWIRKGRLYSDDPNETLGKIVDVGIQMAWGLGHAHRKGLVHQDVKPGNTLLTRDGCVKVTDFGLVRALGSHDLGPGDLGSTSGTPPYSAPEQGEDAPLSLRSDVWSWGASMIEVLLGGLRWQDSTSLLAAFHSFRTHGATEGPVPNLPDSVSRIFEHVLEQDPCDRPEDMQTVVDMLTDAYQEITGTPYDREGPLEQEASADTLNNRAVSLVDLGKGDEADLLWTEALALNPNHVEAAHNQSLNRWRNGTITDMAQLRLSHSLCEQSPKSWLPRYLFGAVAQEWGDSKMALEVLNGIKKQDRNRREVLFAIAKAREREDKSRRLMRDFQAHIDAITSVFISSDGWYVLSGSKSGAIKIWETGMGKFRSALQGHNGPIHSLHMTPDEKLVLSGAADHTARLWNGGTGKCLHIFNGHTDAVRAVRLSDNGRVAVTASTDGTIRVWDGDTGECSLTLEGHSAGINALDLSRCGRYALSGSRDRTLKYWDLTTGKCLRTLEGHKHRIHSVCLSGDRSFALSASRDSTIQMWGLSSGESIKTFRGHRTEAYQVVLSDNQRYLLSGSRQGTLKLWDCATGQCVRSFQGSTPIAMSRDGRYAVSGGENGVLQLWAVACDMDRIPAPFMLARHQNTKSPI
jgi:WD40 repeat protein